MINWFVSQRQAWIMETVRVFGFINRDHIVRKFGVSTQQASTDIKLFMHLNPTRIVYDKSAKRYLALGAYGRRIQPKGENGNTKRRGG